MSDNLRDRIEDTIEAAYAQWEFEFEAHEDGNRAYVDPGPKDAFVAQAIIDEFGLTMESRFVYATDLARDDEPVTDDMAQRIVGKWEQR